MLRRPRTKNAAVTANKKLKKKSTSIAGGNDQHFQRQPLLPEIPKQTEGVAASRIESDKRARELKSAHSMSSAARKKGKTIGLSKSYSDTLVARLSGLSLSEPASKKQTSKSSKGKRYYSTLFVKGVEDIADLIKTKRCTNIIVMAGAGISTPSGIPDFRTPGTGLYDNLAEYNLPDPSAIFDIQYFNYNPKPFFHLAKELYPGNYSPNFVHFFVRMLDEKKQLLRIFTQNIDALERAAGIPDSKLIEAHGSFATATCRKCRAKYNGSDLQDDVMRQVVPICRREGCTGIVKPDIVFFGEDLPKKFFEYPKHFAKCDLLIVLGTSLEVYPFAGLVEEVSKSAPRILINREVVGPFVKRRKRPNDIVVKGDIVESVRHLARLLGWTEAIEMLLSQEKSSRVGTLHPRFDCKPSVPGKVEPEIPVGMDAPERKENVNDNVSSRTSDDVNLFEIETSSMKKET